MGDGADRFARGDSQAEVVGVQVEGRAPRGQRIDRVWCVVREGAEPAGATGVFVLPPQEEAGWRDVASPPVSTVPSTLASFQRRR